RDQVGRRVDLVRRPRERADGPSRDRGGGGDRGPEREVGRAAAGSVRTARGTDRIGGRAARVPGRRLRQVVDPGRVRVRRRDPEDGGREVPEDGAARAVSCRARRDGAGALGRAGGVLKAVLLRELGGPERLKLDDVPEPSGPSVVRVRAAGVNFMDVLIRRGDYPQPLELPAVLGGEVAGELNGQRVMALPRGGGYAEKVAADWVVPLPDGASFVEGAAFLMTFLTAWIPMRSQARVSPGSTVLVHAGAGGVGSAAIQLAGWLGARVVATAGSEEKRAFVLEHGAEEAYSYEEFADAVRADVVVDPVGGEVFAASLKALRP